MPRPRLAPARKDLLWHLERGVVPIETLARALDLFLAERGAVGCGGARLARRAEADDGAAGVFDNVPLSVPELISE